MNNDETRARLNKVMGKVRVEPFGQVGTNNPKADCNWAYSYYVGSFNLGAVKVRTINGFFELFEEVTFNHSRGHFPETRLRIMDTNSPQETDKIMREHADNMAKYIAEEMGLEYIGFTPY